MAQRQIEQVDAERQADGSAEQVAAFTRIWDEWAAVMNSIPLAEREAMAREMIEAADEAIRERVKCLELDARRHR